MSEDDIIDKILDFKLHAKALTKESSKAAIKQQNSIMKAKKALNEGNMQLARTYAEEVIRFKNEAQRNKILGSKLEFIYTRLHKAYKTQQLSDTMASLVDKMRDSISKNNIENLVEMMDNFEKMFDNLDIQARLIEDVFDNVKGGSVNENEVNELINVIQETNAEQIQEKLIGVGEQNNLNGNNEFGNRMDIP